MKSMIECTCIALLGLAAAATPQTTKAGVVGEYNACGTENLSVPVAAAGHTWVSVTILDAASLQNLDALVLRTCEAYGGNAAVDAAVANGMDLILDSQSVNGALLPGAPAMNFGGSCNEDFSLAPSSPVTTGPGGTLTDDSLDVFPPWGQGGPGPLGGVCSILGTTAIASLPAGTIPFVISEDRTHAGALGYTYGGGQVAVSMSQWSRVYNSNMYLYPGIKTYFLNAIGWALSIKPPVTCNREGYTGTKLQWCRNICEMGYTGGTLDNWIHRWISKYRDLPYCMAAPQQPAI